MKNYKQNQSKRLATFKMLILLGVTIIGVLFTNVTQVEPSRKSAYKHGKYQFLTHKDWKTPN